MPSLDPAFEDQFSWPQMPVPVETETGPADDLHDLVERQPGFERPTGENDLDGFADDLRGLDLDDFDLDGLDLDELDPDPVGGHRWPTNHPSETGPIRRTAISPLSVGRSLQLTEPIAEVEPYRAVPRLRRPRVATRRPSARAVRRASLAVAALALLALGVVVIRGRDDGDAFALESQADTPTHLFGTGMPRGYVDRSVVDDGADAESRWSLAQALGSDLAFSPQQLAAAGWPFAPRDQSDEPAGQKDPEIGPSNTWVDSGNGVLVPDLLLRIRFCESTNDYGAANPGSSARGAYQFLAKSWAWFGHAERYGVAEAHLATPAQQDEAALLTLQSQGTRPWSASRHCWADPDIGAQYLTTRPTASPAPPSPPSTSGNTTSTASGSTTTAGGSSTTAAGPTTTTAPATTTATATSTSTTEASTTTTSASTSSTLSSSTTTTSTPTTSSS